MTRRADQLALVAELLDAIRTAELELADLRSTLEWIRTLDPDQLSLYRDETGRVRAGLAQERTFPPPEQEEEAPAPPPQLSLPGYAPGPGTKQRHVPLNISEARARDWAMAQGDRWWSTKELSAALGFIGAHGARPVVNALVKRGTVVTNGTPPTSPFRLYRWAGKPEPADQARSRDQQPGDGRAGGFGSLAVAGTGSGRTSSTDKDYAKVIAKAKARGWRVEPGTKHDRLVHPTGARVVLSGSPSDHRAAANLEAQLRRAERGDPG